MGKPVIGEVVVLPFPQTNLQSSKRRPALVVADLVGNDLVRCQITGSRAPMVAPFLWSVRQIQQRELL